MTWLPEVTILRLLIEMQADVHNNGGGRLQDARMTWHLLTDMDNQFVRAIDVFPPARVVEKAERNMVAIIKVPELQPGESFSPTVTLRIDTTTRDWMMERLETPTEEMSRHRGTYCKADKYWEVDDPLVQEMAEQISSRADSDERYARLAFDTVRKHLRLKTHLDERIGASRAVREKEGDCDEHADLFIALLRAAKIPARRVVGHIYRDGSNPESHAWSEAYLAGKGWVPVDPAIGYFGVLTEQYFSRIREGLVSERPTISIRWSGMAAHAPSVEEEIRMRVVENGRG